MTKPTNNTRFTTASAKNAQIKSVVRRAVTDARLRETFVREMPRLGRKAAREVAERMPVTVICRLLMELP